MEPLLDDLTLLHSQVTGQRVLALQPIPLSNWLVTTLLPWRAAALNKELHWETNIPPDLPTLNIDPTRMAQVLGNLLNNAIGYTPAGGRVQVTAAARENPDDEPGELIIQVSDTGPGIAPEEQERVFEPFYRSRQPQRFSKGLGLGLAIARDLVEAHGGRLEVSSTLGEGSVFTARLFYL
jgi:two-component system sensor histidine kinase BaeS